MWLRSEILPSGLRHRGSLRLGGLSAIASVNAYARRGHAQSLEGSAPASSRSVSSRSDRTKGPTNHPELSAQQRNIHTEIFGQLAEPGNQMRNLRKIREDTRDPFLISFSPPSYLVVFFPLLPYHKIFTNSNILCGRPIDLLSRHRTMQGRTQ